MMNPAGISSEASSGEKKFWVQTEFAPRPKPRITTSISLNGDVVQKVENVWEKLPRSEEDKDEIERFLRKQHQEVMKDVRENGERFVLSKNGAGKIATCEETQWEPVILKVKEVISRIQGVAGWVLFSNDNEITGQAVSDVKYQTMADLAGSSKDLVSLLSSVSKVGNFTGGILESKQMRTAFIPIKNNFLAVKVNTEFDLKELVQKIRSVL
jgi:hypothetical protein